MEKENAERVSLLSDDDVKAISSGYQAGAGERANLAELVHIIRWAEDQVLGATIVELATSGKINLVVEGDSVTFGGTDGS